MKRVGLIGGTTWHSTAAYYRLLNEGIQARLGGVSSADLVLVSLDFAEIVRNNDADDLVANGEIILRAARNLMGVEVEAIVLCANTMHMFADQIVEATGLPVIHIADATAKAAIAGGHSTVALLGTKYVMDGTFYRDRLLAAGVETLVPESADRAFVNASIFDEMAKGIFSDATRDEYRRIVQGLAEQGAQAVVLGCTEIPILIRSGDVCLPTLDTTALHVTAVLDFMTSGEG